MTEPEQSFLEFVKKTMKEANKNCEYLDDIMDYGKNIILNGDNDVNIGEYYKLLRKSCNEDFLNELPKKYRDGLLWFCAGLDLGYEISKEKSKNTLSIREMNTTVRRKGARIPPIPSEGFDELIMN